MKTILIAVLAMSAFSFNSHAVNSCLSVVTGKHLKAPAFDLTKYQQSIGYIRGIDRTPILEISKAISKTNRNDFIELVPKDTFPKADRRLSKPKLVEYSEGLRTPNPAARKASADLFFQTTRRHADKLKSGEAKLKMSSEYSSFASIYLADRTSRLFADKVDTRQYSIIQTYIHPKARILDITHGSLGDRGPTQFSYHASYKWFTDVFVPDLIAGKYKDQFPELTEVAQKHDYDFQRVEVFGLLMKADIVYHSKFEGPLVRNQYWVVNPQAIIGLSEYR